MAEKRVILKYRNLTEIDKDIFTKTSLTLLDVSGNSISVNKNKKIKITKIQKYIFIFIEHSRRHQKINSTQHSQDDGKQAQVTSGRSQRDDVINKFGHHKKFIHGNS